MEPLPTATEALADLRELLASPLTTRPTRERLLARAIAYLETVTKVDKAVGAPSGGVPWEWVATRLVDPQPLGDGRRREEPAAR